MFVFTIKQFLAARARRTSSAKMLFAKSTIFLKILAFIIGIYDGSVRPEQCSKTVGSLADYLSSSGY